MRLEYVDHLGKDVWTPANAARGSFGKSADDYPYERNKSLNGYLSREGHWVPFAHIQVTFKIELPIFLARQLYTHKVGSVKSEVSRRYVRNEPEFFKCHWREVPSKEIKQGSGPEMDMNSDIYRRMDELHEKVIEVCTEVYQEMLASGVAPEQARAELPQHMMTTVIDTGSLIYWARMYKQRTDPHAQKEWKLLMDPLNEKMLELFPISWAELTKERS
jgi:thymidylate synthase (FAD)